MNIEAIVFGGLYRLVQACVQAAPTILIGLLVAGVLRRLVGHGGTRRLFGHGTWRALPQAWLIGMLLPVCSLGVIPIARELRRAGIAGGTILAFAMTAPLFNPVSLLYGLTLSDPVAILSFAAASLLVVTVIGTAWDGFFPGSTEPAEELPPVPYGLRRMAAIGVAGAREIAGPGGGYILAGLVGVSILGMVLPPMVLQSQMEHTNPWAPVTMAAVAIPAYATPMMAMSQLGSMFQHGNSIGAAFVLLALGAGTNLGLIAWTIAAYGLRRGVAWLVLLLAVVLPLAYAMEQPLYPAGVEPAGHTHAFDTYCAPFNRDQPQPAAQALRMLEKNVLPHDWAGVGLLAVWLCVGLVLRRRDRGGHHAESWLEGPVASEIAGSRPWYDVVVPGSVLGGIAMAGLVAFSVAACYAYYPAKEEIFKEMAIIQAEVLSTALSGNGEHAAHFIPIWDDWTRRLEVSVQIREGELSPYRRMKAQVLRERLELLDHAVKANRRAEIRDLVARTSLSYGRLRAAFD